VRATSTSNSAYVSAETVPVWGDVDDWCIDDVQVWEDRVYMSIEHRHTNYRWVVPLGEFVKE
jgi:hypothetical protein